jgi:predicted acetyltransferase
MRMTITIAAVPEKNRALLDAMAMTYFAELLPDGPRYYPSALDRYWTEQGRHPYLINADRSPIGFALVWNHADGTHELTEFAIQPAYRHKGIGTQAAHLIFNALGGDWTLGVATQSPGGMEFWQKCLTDCENACEITTTRPKTAHQCGSFIFRIQR